MSDEAEDSIHINESEAGSGEEQEEYLAPVMDGRNITFQTTLVNKILTCPLCHGYLREPFTITECIHSFCKVCIFRHFAGTTTSHQCPVCNEHLGPNPHDRTLPDRQLQSLIAKIFPEMVAAEEKAEDEFYKSRCLKRPGPDLPPAATPPIKLATPQVPKIPKLAPKGPPPSDDVSFQLLLDTSSPELSAGLLKLEKPLITTSRRVTMNHIKRFLILKLKHMSVDQLDLMYNGEVLGSEHTLDFVLKRNPPRRGQIPTLTYMLKKIGLL